MIEIRGKCDPNDKARLLASARSPIVFMEPCPIGGNGVINPHVTRAAHLDGSYTSFFHVKPIYYETWAGEWRPLSEIAVYYGNTRIELDVSKAWKLAHPRFLRWLEARQRLLGSSLKYVSREGYAYSGVLPSAMATMDTLDAYPEPDTATTACDGRVDRGTSNATWAAARDTATGQGSSTSITSGILFCRYNGNTYMLGRNHYGFDTSSLTSGATISSATFYKRWSIVNDLDNDGNDYAAVVSSSPASNTALAIGDYDAFGLTAYSSNVDWGTVGTSAHTAYTINATGLAAINTSGVTNWGLRHGHDIVDEAVTANNNCTGYYADQSGTTNDPYLSVTYTLASALVHSKLSRTRLVSNVGGRLVS